MPATLFLSPTIDISTQHSLAELEALKSGDPFYPISFLLPTGRVIQDFRKQLGSAVNVNFTQFYGLGQDILEAAGSRVHLISDTSIRWLVRVTLQEMLQGVEISSFAAELDKAGFTSVLIGWLREMNSQAITPEAYLAHARVSGKERDRQLGTFYQRYQGTLQGHDLADPDGALWLACEALVQDRELSLNQETLFVISFDPFSPDPSPAI